ncbi:MAG: hypothetical protein AVDCRST_MAG70-1150 [uncultured Thermomicrobiales bacterium]|uniref:Uncharacterized protein n=1 Tax=uncultured Thermomicrobiales bacterium TaxID=1645740 RepID=A0A6J4UNE5_9BACT|nr:MAG: hypothetical protein AVDCRST_MAG70-1150 [uncultured Thermomicrobiales bacterium]
MMRQGGFTMVRSVPADIHHVDARNDDAVPRFGVPHRRLPRPGRISHR